MDDETTEYPVDLAISNLPVFFSSRNDLLVLADSQAEPNHRLLSNRNHPVGKKEGQRGIQGIYIAGR